MFTVLVLQRDKMVRKARDIRPLLARRVDIWEAGRRRELLQEARHCDKQLVSTSGPKTSEQVEHTFNHLMLQGRVHSTVRLLTERGVVESLTLGRKLKGRQAPWEDGF